MYLRNRLLLCLVYTPTRYMSIMLFYQIFVTFIVHFSQFKRFLISYMRNRLFIDIFNDSTVFNSSFSAFIRYLIKKRFSRKTFIKKKHRPFLSLCTINITLFILWIPLKSPDKSMAEPFFPPSHPTVSAASDRHFCQVPSYQIEGW